MNTLYYGDNLEIIRKYKIVLKKTDEGYSVSCPGLTGCWSQGTTEMEAIENIKDAIEEYLAAIGNSLPVLQSNFN